MALPGVLSAADVPRAVAEAELLRKIASAFGLLALLTGLTGILGNITGILLISSVCFGCKTMALSVALAWILLGAILLFLIAHPPGRVAVVVLRVVLIIVALASALEIFASLSGGHFITESWALAAGSVLFGARSSPVSPVASLLIILAAIGLFFRTGPAFLMPESRHSREITAGAGILVTLTGFTLVLSYCYGSPLFYGSTVIPVAVLSALAAFFTGAGLIAAAGPDTYPVCRFRGGSIRALLLRNFVTLTVTVTLCESLLIFALSSWYHISNAILLSASVVLFTILTTSVVGRLSGEIGQSLDRAERELVHRNEALGELNEELAAAEEELRQTVDDLTRKETELRESEQRLSSHIENSPLAVIGFDAQFRITVWSDEARRMFGWTREEILGKPMRDIPWIHKDDITRVATISADMMNGKAPRNMHEKRNYRKDGSVIECEWYNSAIRDPAGNLLSIQSQVLDVTSRNRIARAMEENERFLRETEKIAHLGGWKANPETGYLRWTEGVYAIIEAPRDYRPGFDEGLKYFSPEDRPLIRDRIRYCLATGEPFSFEVMITTGTGRKVWTELRGLSPVMDGPRSSVIGTFQDITGRRQIEENLKRENEQRDILAEAARLLLSSEKPERIVLFIAERLMRHLGCHAFFNYLIDDKAERLRLNAWAGIRPEDAAAIEYLDVGNAVCGEVARSGKHILVHDILESDDERVSLARTFGISGYVCHPLIYQGRILGTLSFGTRSRVHFTDEELGLIQAVTDLVATAMARKTVEDTLRGTSQYLESLIDYANAPIIVWDRELRILRFNHAFEFLTGMSAIAVLGKQLGFLFPDESRDESMALIQKTGSGERWESVEIPIRHVSGATRIVLWNSASIYEEDGTTIVSTIAQGLDITERKIAEDAARQTASLINAALDSTADGILVVGTDGKITSYNTIFCDIWGIPEHTLTGAEEKQALASMTPLVSDPQEFLARLRELYSHPARESYDMVSLADGRIFERYSKPQKIGDVIVGRVWSYRDITERKRAEDLLRMAHLRTEAILESIADTFFSLDSRWQFTTVNPAAEKAPFGRPAAELLGRVIWDLYPDLVGTQTYQRYLEVLKNRALEHYEAQSPLNGRWYKVFMKGREDGVDVYMRDITVRREAEEALQESMEKFRIIATNTPDQILVQDRELRYTQVINPPVGLTVPEMLGRTDQDILTREDAEALTSLKQLVLESGTPVYQEITMTDSKGGKNYFAGSYVPKRNAAGETDGIIGYFKNITETRQANEKILAALAEKEILIREIHHRVKNNLQIISGLLDMTRMRTADPATTGILTDMMMKIKTMAQIHTRLYESRQFDRVNMGGQIRDQVADLASIYGRSGSAIQCQVDAEDLFLPVDQAIPCALVVNEALSNAFKHAFRGRTHGTITVRARQEGGIVRIRVSDDGIGIPADVDIDRATSLGLKLIRSLVMQLRGTVAIGSNRSGSSVDMEFPVLAG